MSQDPKRVEAVVTEGMDVSVAGVRSTKHVLFVTNLISNRRVQAWVGLIARRADTPIVSVPLPDGEHEISTTGDIHSAREAMVHLMPNHDVWWDAAYHAIPRKKRDQPFKRPRPAWWLGERRPPTPTPAGADALKAVGRHNHRISIARAQRTPPNYAPKRLKEHLRSLDDTMTFS